MTPEEVCTLDGDALVLDLSPLAPALRLTSWAEGLAVSTLDDGAWGPVDRTGGLRLSLDLEEGTTSAAGRFVATIPAGARLLASRCAEHSLAALRLLRGHVRARVMARTPNLLWLVAKHADTVGLAAALALLDQAPREVLVGCLGPLAPGALGLLARIPPEPRALDLALLATALASPRVVSALRHVRTVDMARLRAPGGDPGAALRARVPEAHRFPPPRLAGTPSIVALEDSGALFREGLYMKHCVFLLEKACREGRVSVYSVWVPERATLVLSNEEDPELLELRGARNAEVGPETVAAISAWLARGDRWPDCEDASTP